MFVDIISFMVTPRDTNPASLEEGSDCVLLQHLLVITSPLPHDDHETVVVSNLSIDCTSQSIDQD